MTAAASARYRFGVQRVMTMEAPKAELKFEPSGVSLAALARSPDAAGVLPGDTAAQALRKIGMACLNQISINAARLRTRRSMEALHQMRIGLRRLRAALTAFKPMASGAGLAEIRAETLWLARALDEARDLDIFIRDSFRTAEVADQDRAACALLGEHLLNARTSAYEQVLKTVQSDRYAALAPKIASWLEDGDWTRGEDAAHTALRDKPIAWFAARRLNRLWKRVLKSGRHLASLDAEGRHALRIRVKKLRYVAEFFTAAFDGGRARSTGRFLALLEDLQDQLGRMNDIFVADRLAATLVQGQPPSLAFAAGLIIGARQDEGDKALYAARKSLDRLRRVRPFWD